VHLYIPVYPQYVEIKETWELLYSAWFLADGIVRLVDRSKPLMKQECHVWCVHPDPVITVDNLMLEFQANKHHSQFHHTQ